MTKLNISFLLFITFMSFSFYNGQVFNIDNPPNKTKEQIFENTMAFKGYIMKSLWLPKTTNKTDKYQFDIIYNKVDDDDNGNTLVTIGYQLKDKNLKIEIKKITYQKGSEVSIIYPNLKSKEDKVIYDKYKFTFIDNYYKFLEIITT